MLYSSTHSDKIALLNESLDSFFTRSIDEASKVDPSYRLLWETLYSLIRSGGKRLRPTMTLAAYEAFGGKDIRGMIPVAAAQELLHFSLLIHDDIIDRDYTRYGTLNIAGRYKVTYSKFLNDLSEQTHFAHGAALLGGDLMLSSAHKLITDSTLGSQEKTIASTYLINSIFEVAGGELLDTESSFVPYKDGDALKIARYKTASYSFKSPLLTGAIIAGASDAQAAILKEFALAIGIAFQLVDDLLGAFGEEETTGKSITSDITEGKRTFMVEQAMNAMTIVEKDRFMKSFGNRSAIESDVENVRQLLISTGAKKRAEIEVQKYADKARVALSRLKLDEKHQEEFEKLIKTVTERSF